MKTAMQPSRGAQFSDLSLAKDLVELVSELGYAHPTPVQAQSIPLLLQGKDLIGQSETGSGKTAAFALPILNRLERNLGQSRDSGPRPVQALVLCPTRELGAQVAREIRRLARRHLGLQVLVLTGGAPMGDQLTALEKGAHIVVGTPGRVIDHLKRGTLDLSGIKTLVLDEADRMLEMGFQEDVERVLDKCPHDRQTVLFSATFPEKIESLSRAYQRAPVRVTVVSENKTVASIRQVVYEVELPNRVKTLLWVLEQNKPESAIVFCNFKASVVELLRQLAAAGLSVGALHGDLEQSERDRVMAKFRNRSTRLLIATDVAARGIDVQDLDAVVNFELPHKPEIYVHRVGRTGRAGKSGLAVSFHGARELGKVAMIEKYSGVTLQKKKVAPLESIELETLHERAHRDAEMKTLFISGGRKEKMRPGDILGALTGEAGGLKGADIGKIEIHDRFSYVAVSAKIASLALQRLRDGRIKGRRFRIEPVR
jgi:ATP-independent RNA helicase DbpA